MTACVIFGFVAKSTPPLTFGQDMFNSTPASCGKAFSFSASTTNSSALCPATLAMIGQSRLVR